MPFLEPDDRVRRQQLLVIGFGKGRGAIKVDSRLVDTLQRWVAWFALSVLLVLPFWQLLPAVTFLAGLCLVVYRWLADRGRLVAGLVTAVIAVMVWAQSPVSLLAPLPFLPALAGAVAGGWFASKPVSLWVDADRPFSYWWAVLRAEVAAARPFPKETTR